MVRWFMIAALLFSGCSRASFDEQDARRAIVAYVGAVAEAYRTSDEAVVAPLVSDGLARTLTALVGVKRDMGLALDARVLDLRFEGMRLEGESVSVETRERWYYRDLKLATGEQVGDDSIDEYAMRYRLVWIGGQLKVDETEFREPPKVGRSTTPPVLEAKRAHGLD